MKNESELPSDNNFDFRDISKRKLMIIASFFNWQKSKLNIKRSMGDLFKKNLIKVFLIIAFTISFSIIVLYLKGVLRIEKDTLHYFYSAVSQSMAALFGVAGMFSVFRFQSIDNRLRNLYEIVKNRFNDWISHFGITNSKTWHDSEVYDKVSEKIKSATKRKFPQPIIEELEKRKREISKLEILKFRLLSSFCIPLFLISVTFVVSVIGIIISSSMVGKLFGIIFLALTFLLTAISIATTFDYIYSSIVSYLKESLDLEI